MSDMTAIRNACVARGSQAAGTSGFVYTVPAGYVLLLKSVYLRPEAQATNTFQMFVFSADMTTNVEVFTVESTSTSLSPWEGWLALNGGDQIYVGAVGSAIWFWISGALLPYASALPSGAIAG